VTRTAWAGIGVLVLAGVVVVQGGEFSTWNYLELKRRVVEERKAVAQLEREVDSLTKELKAIETDPEVQERMARERFGMIRPGEHLYRLTLPDEP
jgi:cell division protein FtsB